MMPTEPLGDDLSGYDLDAYGCLTPVALITEPFERVTATAPLVGAPHRGPVIAPMPDGHEGRSGRWKKCLRDFLAAHPLCEGTGEAAETAHHVVPFHDDPDLELVWTNLVPVTVAVHFLICHMKDWRRTNPHCREHLRQYREWYRSVVGR